MDELREKIAREIEPAAWTWLDRGKYLQAHRPIVDESLAKADAILALLPQVGGGWEHTGYEADVLVNGDWVAGAEGESLHDVQREAKHYALMYASEGVTQIGLWDRGRRPLPPPHEAENTPSPPQNGERA